MRSEMCMCQQRDRLPGPNLNSEAERKARVGECRFECMTKSYLDGTSGGCDEEEDEGILGCFVTEPELLRSSVLDAVTRCMSCAFVPTWCEQRRHKSCCCPHRC